MKNLIAALAMSALVAACGGGNAPANANHAGNEHQHGANDAGGGHGGMMDMQMMHSHMSAMGEGMKMMNECPAMKEDAKLKGGMDKMGMGHSGMQEQMKMPMPSMPEMRNHMGMMREGMNEMRARMNEHDDAKLKDGMKKLEDAMKQMEEAMEKSGD